MFDVKDLYLSNIFKISYRRLIMKCYEYAMGQDRMTICFLNK